jgi:hypothetical protein
MRMRPRVTPEVVVLDPTGLAGPNQRTGVMKERA